MKVICISSTVMLSAPPPCSAACTSAEAAGQPAAAQQEHIPALQGDAGGAAGLVDARRLIAAARGVLPGDLLRQALVQEMRPLSPALARQAVAPRMHRSVAAVPESTAASRTAWRAARMQLVPGRCTPSCSGARTGPSPGPQAARTGR